MSGAVFDASVVLALLLDEPGARVAEERLDGAVVSTVSLAEVMAKLTDRGVVRGVVLDGLAALGVGFEPVTVEDAELQATVREHELARRDGPPVLSLADRLCLALGLRTGWPVLTADREWAGLGLAVQVELLR